jgi:basic amino acid/polyamine antiporter, APA family
VLFTYGGWNEMSYVAAEVRDPRRNILRALVLGAIAVTLVYLLVNVAFVGALGFQGVRETKTLASDVLRIPFGESGANAISVLICISCLGAINGMIFTGARVYYALGTEHRAYAWLGHWNERLQTPVRSLVLQGIVTMLLVAFFYLSVGENSFTGLIAFTAPLFWLFLLLVGISFLILRETDAKTARPFRAPLYPLEPLLFIGSSGFMLHAAITYAMGQSVGDRPWYLHFESLWPVGVMLIGLLLSFFDPRDGV